MQEKQRHTARALDAIAEAEKEMRPGEPLDTAALKRLIQAIEVRTQSAFIQRFLTDEQVAALAELGKTFAGQEWRIAAHDLEDALKDGAAGEKARALLARSEELLKKDPTLRATLESLRNDAGFRAAAHAANAEEWPAGKSAHMQKQTRRMREFLVKAHAAAPGLR